MGNSYISRDVEAELIARFRRDWPGVRVARDAPAKIPDRLVTIRRGTPGRVTAAHTMDEAHIDVNVWSADPEAVDEFARQVASWFEEQRSGGFYRSDVTTPSDPGDSTGTHRRYFYADIGARRVRNDAPAWGSNDLRR